MLKIIKVHVGLLCFFNISLFWQMALNTYTAVLESQVKMLFQVVLYYVGLAWTH